MSGPGLNWRGVFVIVVLALIALAAWIFFRVESWPARTAGEVAQVFSQVVGIQPKIIIHDRVVLEQATSILELAVLSRETQVERESEHEWLGSKKRLKLRGVYLIKAGFDLNEPFSLEVEDHRIIIEFPDARILSLDQVSVEVLALENGIWNRISAQDLESEIHNLPAMARQKAQAAGVEAEATAILTQRLREKFGSDYRIEIRARPKASAEQESRAH